MPEEWQKQLADLTDTYYWSAQVSYGYFCDKPETNLGIETKKD
jgi:hypothetical protein